MNRQKRERRLYPRIDRILTCRVQGDDFDIVTETQNVSGTGAYCEVNRYIAPMTKLKLNLVLPVANHVAQAAKISCQGIVVRTEPEDNLFLDNYHVAIYFNRISKASLKKIANYVSNQMNHPAGAYPINTN